MENTSASGDFVPQSHDELTLQILDPQLKLGISSPELVPHFLD